MDVKAILDATRKSLGAEADLSYITAEQLEKASKVEAIEITTTLGWQYIGNSLTQYSDGHWEWWDDCLAKKRWRYNGSLHSQRLPNCMTGLIQYRIWG